MALIEEFESRGNWLFKYRSWLPLALLAGGVVMFSFTELNPRASFSKGTSFETLYEYFCLSVCFFGLFIRVYTVGYTPKNTSGRNVHGQVADVLNTKGIYSLVRHPLYLGNFFMWLGPAMLTGHAWFIVVFCLAYWLYYERIMFAEEQFLRKQFGTLYTDWAANLPAFWPKLSGFKSAEGAFNWVKVIRNEKNGLLAVFAIFVIFEILDLWLDQKSSPNWFFIGGLAFSIFYYLVVKFLIKKTNVLQD
jgi:protein-S-isoprenylcysteine O-methyltransferase Ste14